MSNMTHRVSREEDGLKLTCEAFNKGTHFSKTQISTLTVYCESPLRVVSQNCRVFSRKKIIKENEVSIFFFFCNFIKTGRALVQEGSILITSV